MKFRIDFSKEGSKEFVDSLCDYIESWNQRKTELNFSRADDMEDSFCYENKESKADSEIENDFYDSASNEIQIENEEFSIDDASDEKIEINKNEEFIAQEDFVNVVKIEDANEDVTDEFDIAFSNENRSNEVINQLDEENIEANVEVSITQIEQKVLKSPRRPSNLNKIAEKEKHQRKNKNVIENEEKEQLGQTDNTKRIKKRHRKEKLTKGAIVGRIFGSLGTFIAAILILVLCADLIVLYGPSKAARDRFVLTVTETSAAGFLATWFLPDEIVNTIIDGSGIQESGGSTDTTLIEFPENSGTENGDSGVDINSVELVNIEGKTYKGKLLIVQNPKRVYLGTPEAYGEDKQGVETINMVKNKNALYGINGGGFYDTGKGNGGIPTGRENSSGIVISKGKLMWGSLSREYEVIGINKKGVLVLGNMTAQQALDQGIVEALNFGPFLVMNGEACEVGGLTEAGLNPRTAIGQRKDGAMLLLTIDGRQPSSVGASYEDLIEVMMNYGAVNAANLDGGSSTYMVQNSETENNPQIITQCASLYGPRKMATSVLVSRVDQINEQYE